VSGSVPVVAIDAQEVLRLGTATLYEASKLSRALSNTIQAAWPGAQVVGRALPVATVVEDNLPLHLAIEACQPGDVLVVEAASSPFGYWGHVMTVAAAAKEAAGIVINGCVRDVDAIEDMGFPVFATGRSIVGTLKGSRGRIGLPVDVAGTRVNAGDIVVGDADGVIVIPADGFEAVLEAARQRAEAEASYMERLRNGELTVDIYDLRSLGFDS
jgi:4-hydroxy-4-methyl-2-oxoglutarate aldolase